MPNPADPTAPPRLTDRAALARSRARAETMAAPATFLHDLVRADLEERLAEVNRAFTDQVLITGLPRFWAGALPDARRIADTEVLDLAPGSADLIVDALTLHWADDPVGRLVQIRRGLRPDGLFIGFLFGGRSLQELRAALATAEAALRGGLSPRVAPMAEIRDLGAVLQRAGFALPVADSLLHDVSYPGPRALMADLRAMGEANALAHRERRFLRRDVLEHACNLYATQAGPDGRVCASVEIVTLTGWAPDESQQKPLRPGSATHRLADALGTREAKLPRGSGD